MLLLPNWVIQRVNDVGAAEGRARANVIDFNDPCEPGMLNFNEHADDDDDSTYHDDYSCSNNLGDDLLFVPSSDQRSDTSSDNFNITNLNNNYTTNTRISSNAVPDENNNLNGMNKSTEPTSNVSTDANEDSNSTDAHSAENDIVSDPEEKVDDGDLGIDENHMNTDEVAATEPAELSEFAENEASLSDWTGGARRSNRLAGRAPNPNFGFSNACDNESNTFSEPNFGMPNVSNNKIFSNDHDAPNANNDDSNAFSNDHDDETNVSFAAMPAEDEKPAELYLAAFEEQHAGGMYLFQQSLDLSIDARDEKLKEFNVSFDKSSLRDRVEEFMITDDPMSLQPHLIGVPLNQMSAKKGIAKHGDRAREALFTEFLQLCGVDTFVPMRKKNLTKQQRKSSLRAMSVVKEKRDGSLKGRTWAFGKAQRGLC